MNVSVIIPTLNEASVIEGAVASARAFGGVQNEVIVVDGGSDDRTVELARAAGASRVLTSRPGRAAQQNAGAAAAHGDVLVFLHADCRLPANCTTEVRELFRSHGVVGAFFRQRIDSWNPLYRLLELGNYLRARYRKSISGDQGLVVRAAVFQDLKGFPDVPLLEDWLLSKKLRRCGRIAVMQKPLTVSPRRRKKGGSSARRCGTGGSGPEPAGARPSNALPPIPRNVR